MPCADGGQESHDHQHTEQSVDASGHDHDHDGADGCTPFCICSCCGAITFKPALTIILPDDIPVPDSRNFHFTENSSVGHFNPIFEPPRV